MGPTTCATRGRHVSPPAGAHTHEPNCDPNPRGPTEYDAGAHLAKREGGGSHVVRVRVHANPWYGVVIKKIKLNFFKKNDRNCVTGEFGISDVVSVLVGVALRVF